MWAEHSFSFTSLSSSFYHTLSLSFSLASFNCHMSVFHSALRFICMYVFMSFSVWVCTDIYSNISALSLSLSTHPFCQFSFTSFQTIQSLSLSKFWGLQWQVEWAKWGNIYMYSCVHVSHIACKTSKNSWHMHWIYNRMTKRSEHDTSLTNMQVMFVSAFLISVTRMG